MEHRVSASGGTIIIDTAALIPRETPELRQLGDAGGDAPGLVAGGFRGLQDAITRNGPPFRFPQKKILQDEFPIAGSQAAHRKPGTLFRLTSLRSV